MDQELQQQLHGAAEESPGAWLLRGLNLHAAAIRLHPKDAPVSDDEKIVSFLLVYAMLLGMAFEALLKGIITMSRIEGSGRPPLPRECWHHGLAGLASRPECRSLHFSDEELTFLGTLSPFVEWGGRYPHPKRASDITALGWSSECYRVEAVLWDRLTAVLNDRGWVMKGGPESRGGKRLYFNNRNASNA